MGSSLTTTIVVERDPSLPSRASRNVSYRCHGIQIAVEFATDHRRAYSFHCTERCNAIRRAAHRRSLRHSPAGTSAHPRSLGEIGSRETVCDVSSFDASESERLFCASKAPLDTYRKLSRAHLPGPRLRPSTTLRSRTSSLRYLSHGEHEDSVGQNGVTPSPSAWKARDFRMK